MKKIALYLSALTLILISACKKDTSIGADILPSDDLLNVRFADTFTMSAKTLADTFLRTDKLNRNYLGVIHDATFGSQQGYVAFEVDKPSVVYDDSIMTTFTVDSVVLLLKYNSVYGDTLVAQDFNVNKITTKINESNAYYSNTSFGVGDFIGSISNYNFKPTNRVVVNTGDSIGIAGILRVKLNNTFGEDILNLKQNILRDSSLFKNNFPGIIIKNATASGNAMAEIDLSSAYSGVAIYYKDKYGVNRDMRLSTQLLRFKDGAVYPKSNGVNIFDNTLSSTIQNVISSGQASDSLNYLLGQGGTTVKISIPTVNNLGRLAVNKAALYVTQVIANNSKDLKVPFTLLLLKRNSSGTLDLLPTGEGAGQIDSVGVDGSGNRLVRYQFNIPRYIQSISTGTEANTDLYMATYRSGGTDGTDNVLSSYTILNDFTSTTQFGYLPCRVIFAGPNYSDTRYKMKLNLIYTIIE